MLIYIVRHGETDWNRKKIVQGASDVPLNDYGIRLAEITSEAMKDIPFDRIYSSPLKRAYKTAEILRGSRQLPIITDDRLKEMHFGIAEHMSLPLIRSLPFLRIHKCFCHPDQYVRAVPGGETIQQVQERGMSFMEEVIKPLGSSCENILIAAHGGIIRGILSSLLQTSADQFWDGFALKNCAVSILELKDGTFRVIRTGKLYYTPKKTPDPRSPL